jgi:hypothetical protein
VIIVDRPLWRWRGRRWAHLASDTHYDELHAFAERLGMRREWFQGDHYDLPDDRWDEAVALGATPISSRELVRRLHAAGLRRPRRPRADIG